MARKSMIWATNNNSGRPALGDGRRAYTQRDARQFLGRWHIANIETGGILSRIGNEFEVSGSSSPLSVNTGHAFVYGMRCWNDASVSVTVETPVRDAAFVVVLRKDWATNLITAVAKRAEAGTLLVPAMYRVEGVRWEIPLATGVIDSSGNIWKNANKQVAGVTDARHYAISPRAGMVRLRSFVGSDETFIRWEGIQQDLSHLRIVGMGRGLPPGIFAADVPSSVSLTINNDEADDNYSLISTTFNDTAGIDTAVSSPVSQDGRIVANLTDEGVTDTPDMVVIDIPFYSSDSTYKEVRAHFVTNGELTAATATIYQNFLWWKSTEPIHTLRLLRSQSDEEISTGFEAEARWELYGLL